MQPLLPLLFFCPPLILPQRLSLLPLVTLYSFYCKSVQPFKVSFTFPIVITSSTNQKAPNQARELEKLLRRRKRMGKDSESSHLIFLCHTCEIE